MDRKKSIKGYIQLRKRDNESPMPCIFQITVPKYSGRMELEDDENIKIVTNIFDKYGISWDIVDTVCGAYNLNRDWIETGDIPCYIEYCGVYPVDWDVEDSATLEKMEYDGKIIVKVMWHPEKEKFIDNH